MAFTIYIKRQAKKTLQNLSQPDRNRIVEKITMLGQNPDNASLDVKRMVGEPHYRLRIGNWRIIYDRDDHVKIISIEKIKTRGDVYK